jgi:hypothetical protein
MHTLRFTSAERAPKTVWKSTVAKAIYARREAAAWHANVSTRAAVPPGAAPPGRGPAAAASDNSAPPPPTVATLATMEWLARTAATGSTSFDKHGVALYLQCRPMSAAVAARRDLRLGCRLLLKRSSDGRPVAASAGPGFLWGPAMCPHCPGYALDTWHRVTSCVDTAPAREAALHTLDALLRTTTSADPPPADAAAFWSPLTRDIHAHRDTQHGRTFTFLATLGAGLPGGAPHRSYLPAAWWPLLDVPALPALASWRTIKGTTAVSATFPAFDGLARAACKPLP